MYQLDTDEDGPIDLDVLDGWRALSVPGQENPFAQVIKVYLTSGPERLDKMQSALDRNDTQALVAVAHSLKGSSGTFGAMQLHTLCFELEKMARAGDLAAAREFYPAVVLEFERVRSFLCAEFNL
ncbi:MAG: Hpt domain-containing protein [Blastocatellia bacterium]|nr:Hpt domain-containing protein [Blastocatellia bacterium]